jgi:pimeloyl-ACP methyl ester carboxylesterase
LVEETARQAGGPVVLVGHSLGGLTITAVAEAVPERLSAVVYVAGFLLPTGMSALSMIRHATMVEALVPSLFLADPQAVGALRLDPRSDNAEYRERLRAAFYGDLSEADFARALADLYCDEPVGVALEPAAVTEARFGRVPRHYVRCLEDHAIPLSGQDFMIAAVDDALGGPTIIHTLPASHSPFYSQPRALADILLTIAGSSTDRTRHFDMTS